MCFLGKLAALPSFQRTGTTEIAMISKSSEREAKPQRTHVADSLLWALLAAQQGNGTEQKANTTSQTGKHSEGVFWELKCPIFRLVFMKLQVFQHVYLKFMVES